ncbi:hypothetical protein [Nostoc sp.]|uniref:hypothetical protein n=1 Tax=Nostoc sp. TaxID=1180 RepID=UPI002FFAC679
MPTPQDKMYLRQNKTAVSLSSRAGECGNKKSDRLLASEIPSCYTVVNIKPHHNSNEIAQMK